MTVTDVLFDDLQELLELLGLGIHARPYSAHEVMQREVLPAVRALTSNRGEKATSTKCPKCDGCGRIGTDDEGTPWTAWENLPVKSAAAVVLGFVRPVTCPECAGSGSATR